MTKLIVRIFGGLGNQLFSYAAARRLAIKNDAELVLDNVTGFSQDKLYRRSFQLGHFNIDSRLATAKERLEPFSRTRRAAKRRWNKCLPFARRNYLAQEFIDFDSRLLELKLRGTVYFEGYWQSQKYFEDVKEIIREDLIFVPPKDSRNLELSEKVSSCTSIAVHVRFFDDPEVTSGNNASKYYYARAVEFMESIVPSAHYFVFSDRPTEALSCLGLPESRVTLISNNLGDDHAYADLWLMSLCRHFIIANSTFSWWGAWLSNHHGKIVVAPGFEMRHGKMAWGFDGLLPEEWIKI